MSDEWKVIPSQLARKSANPLQEFLTKAKGIGCKKSQETQIDLSTESLCQPPDEITDCIIQTLQGSRYNGYAPSIGYEETRQSVLYYLNLPMLLPKDVILSSGSSSCLDIAITALAERGQNIFVPKACDPRYKLLAHGLGVKTTEYNLTSTWEVDLVDLGRKMSSNTAVLLINNPHNPTGAVYEAEHLKALLQLAHRHRIPVIVDESYRDCTFSNERFISAIDINEEISCKVPMLVCGGIGKSFMVPGWRVGWILIHDPINAFEDVRKALVSLSQRIIGCNTFIQGAICNIVSANRDFKLQYLQDVQSNAKCLYCLNNKYGITVTLGKSIYAFIRVNINLYNGIHSSEEFCFKLQEEQGVLTLPGEIFGMEGYLRIALDANANAFEEGIQRLLLFCQMYSAS